MSKNSKYKREYKITLQGISTNDFMPDMIEELLRLVLSEAELRYKQLDAKIERL